MVSLYTAGKSFQAIAKTLGRHWQTVRKYTTRELQESEGRALRREALMRALMEHYGDLVQALQSLPSILRLPDQVSYQPDCDWQPRAPDRRTGLLLDALRESHIKDSNLWAWWDRWDQIAKSHAAGVQAIRARVSTEMTKLEKSAGRGARITTDRLAEILFQRAYSISCGSPIHDPSSLRVRAAEVVQAMSNPERLLLDESVVAEGPGMGDLKERLAKVMKRMVDWEEVRQLTGLHGEMTRLQESIAEEVEILSLRRAFPGHCRLCPV